MPVKVRCDVAEAREVDLGRFQHLALGALDGQHRFDKPVSRLRIEVRHLANVIVPDHPGEAGEVRIVDEHHVKPFVGEDDGNRPPARTVRSPQPSSQLLSIPHLNGGHAKPE